MKLRYLGWFQSNDNCFGYAFGDYDCVYENYRSYDDHTDKFIKGMWYDISYIESYLFSCI